MVKAEASNQSQVTDTNRPAAAVAAASAGKSAAAGGGGGGASRPANAAAAHHTSASNHPHHQRQGRRRQQPSTSHPAASPPASPRRGPRKKVETPEERLRRKLLGQNNSNSNNNSSSNNANANSGGGGNSSRAARSRRQQQQQQQQHNGPASGSNRNSSSSSSSSRAVEALPVQDRRPGVRYVAGPGTAAQQQGTQPRTHDRTETPEERPSRTLLEGSANSASGGNGGSGRTVRSQAAAAAAAAAASGDHHASKERAADPSLRIGAIAVAGPVAQNYDGYRPSRFNDNELQSVYRREGTTAAVRGDGSEGAAAVDVDVVVANAVDAVDVVFADLVPMESGDDAHLRDDRTTTNKGGILFGMSKRRCILIGVAVMVVIIGAAVGGAAASGAFGGNTTNNNVAQCSFLNASPAQVKLLPNDGAADDRFGQSVAIDGDTIVVGAYWDDTDNGLASGSAYVFTRESTGTAWRQQSKLLPNDGDLGDWFGYSVAINGDAIVVGAFLDDTDNGSDSGSAYVFTRESTGTAWRQQAKLLPNDGAADDYFGLSVAIDGDTIVIGAYGDDDNGSDSGSAYVFTRESTGTAWRQQAKLLPNDGAADDRFGESVAIDGNTIVVGALWDDNDNGSNIGSAYVFTRESTGTAWRQQSKLIPNDGAREDEFGFSVAIDGDTIVVGAPYDDDNGSDSGSAYVFTRESTGTAWRQQAKLLPNDGAADDWFGVSVAIDGVTIVVGAKEDDDKGSDSGSAYVFTRTSTGMAWRQQAKLLPNDGAAEDWFGWSVAIDGVTIVVGAYQGDDNGVDSGSAYTFDFC